MKGLTLTPSAMLAHASLRLLVTGEAKAEAVLRAVKGDEDPHKCPVRVLADHPDVLLWLDEAAAELL
jgi:6-phosphogluconolactonase/glucosamine-6-phosphate isomerase/deaminase